MCVVVSLAERVENTAAQAQQCPDQSTLPHSHSSRSMYTPIPTPTPSSSQDCASSSVHSHVNRARDERHRACSALDGVPACLPQEPQYNHPSSHPPLHGPRSCLSSSQHGERGPHGHERHQGPPPRWQLPMPSTPMRPSH